MIQYIEGNLLESNAQALVNTVNTKGVMGKGIALQFKNQFPENYKVYFKACNENKVETGQLFITEQTTMFGKQYIVNFPTKTHWRKPSEYSYIESGLIQLEKFIKEKQIQSIAIPLLGSGNGGLDWNKVKLILEKHLHNLECQVFIYEPNYTVKEALKHERVKMTPERAMLLSVLYDLVSNGEFVSEFSAEKTAYFLQRFGEKQYFNLQYKPDFYGPYSGKVKHVLYYLNGSYICGYSTKDRKPFQEIGIIPDGKQEVENYIDTHEDKLLIEITNKTKEFLKGFYSSFALELLSTIDYVITEKNIKNVDEIIEHLNSWSNRKKTMFTNPRFIDIALLKLQNELYNATKKCE